MTWTPAAPPPELRTAPPSSIAWRAYLAREGYTAAEAAQVLGEIAGHLAARLDAVARARLALGDELDPSEASVTWSGAVAMLLAETPPALIATLDHRPPLYLSAQGLGARLADSGEAPELGARLLVDRLTGARWWGRVYTDPDQAGTTVVAAQLYQLLGVAVPRVRLAQVQGAPWAVHPEPRAWSPLDALAVARWGRTLAAELPADAWIGNTGGPAAMRARLVEIPDTAGTLRLDLSACLTFRGPGRRDPTWTVDDLAELRAALDAPPRSNLGKVYTVARASPELLAERVKRISMITEAEIVAAVNAGGLGPRPRAGLVAALIGRRELVAAEFGALISGAIAGA